MFENDDKLVNRFFKKVKFPSDWSGCWNWTAARHPRGYGHFFVYGKVVNAHRVAWWIFIGDIPEGKELDHLCKNRSCVNPLHLEPVTHAENVARGDVALFNNSKTHCPQGHEYNEANTNYNKKINRRTCRVCNRDRMRGYRAGGLYSGAD